MTAKRAISQSRLVTDKASYTEETLANRTVSAAKRSFYMEGAVSRKSAA